MGKIQLRNREIDDYGRVAFNEDGLCELLRKGMNIDGSAVLPGEWLDRFMENCKLRDDELPVLGVLEDPGISVEEFDKINQSHWNIPEKYKSMDILEWMIDQCSSEEEQIRVVSEWVLYEERGLVMLLKTLKYLVDFFRENKILWGVGRGSAVSSYCLYVIGIHKINSLKYGLDISEFLK